MLTLHYNKCLFCSLFFSLIQFFFPMLGLSDHTMSQLFGCHNCCCFNVECYTIIVLLHRMYVSPLNFEYDTFDK